MNATISNFQVVRPAFELKQEESLNWLATIHARASGEERASLLNRLQKIGLGKDKIQTRGVSIGDFFHQEWEKMEVYHPSGADFGKRGAVFDRVATDVMNQFYPLGEPLPSHLVHVTCTGYGSPSPAQKIVSLRQAGAITTVTHAYHMGCYAALPAIRMGLGFGGADIVHTEMCSLHLNSHLQEMEQLVVQTLFADGFIKYSLQSGLPGFEILSLLEEIIPDSLDMMSWVCQSWGLKMTLAKEVPLVIAKALPSFVKKLREQKDCYFAIHPGGPKVIQQVAKILQLEPWQFQHSLKVLQRCGNMSSATLPHIWNEVWNDPSVKNGAHVISLAFGPGLTLAGGFFRCCRG